MSQGETESSSYSVEPITKSESQQKIDHIASASPRKKVTNSRLESRNTPKKGSGKGSKKDSRAPRQSTDFKPKSRKSEDSSDQDSSRKSPQTQVRKKKSKHDDTVSDDSSSANSSKNTSRVGSRKESHRSTSPETKPSKERAKVTVASALPEPSPEEIKQLCADLENGDWIESLYETALTKEDINLPNEFVQLVCEYHSATRRLSVLYDRMIQGLGNEYLKAVFRPLIDSLYSVKNLYTNPLLVPEKLQGKINCEENMQFLLEQLDSVMARLSSEAQAFPQPCQEFLWFVRERVAAAFNFKDREVDHVMGVVLFLRCFSPAIVTPHNWSLRSDAPGPEALRNLVTASRLMQHLANNLIEKPVDGRPDISMANNWKENSYKFLRSWLTKIACPDQRGMQTLSLEKDFTEDLEKINLKKLFYWIGDLRDSQQSIEEQVKKAAGPSKLHVRQLHKLITLGDRWVPQKSKSKHVSLSVLRKSNSIDIIKASAVIKAPFAVVLDVLQNYDPKFWSKRNHAELADCRVVEQTGHHQSMWYQQYAVPFPFSNYDQIHIHHRFVSQETQKALICIYSTAGTEFELPPNFIRWFVKGSGWLVDGSKSPTECEVVSIIQHETDPAVTHIDRIPDWLVKWAEIAIVRDLGKLKDYVEGEQDESAKAIKEMERKQAREQKEVSRKTSTKTRK